MSRPSRCYVVEGGSAETVTMLIECRELRLRLPHQPQQCGELPRLDSLCFCQELRGKTSMCVTSSCASGCEKNAIKFQWLYSLLSRSHV